MTDETLIDRAALDTLLESVGGDMEFLTELADDYFEDATTQFENMRLALKRDDAEPFRRAAHSLKSNSENFGASQLAALCKFLEGMGKAGNLANAPGTLEQATELFERVRVELELIVSEG